MELSLKLGRFELRKLSCVITYVTPIYNVHGISYINALYLRTNFQQIPVLVSSLVQWLFNYNKRQLNINEN
jgi:hypothetical protein